jgi:hypothetical protein
MQRRTDLGAPDAKLRDRLFADLHVLACEIGDGGFRSAGVIKQPTVCSSGHFL